MLINGPYSRSFSRAKLCPMKANYETTVFPDRYADINIAQDLSVRSIIFNELPGLQFIIHIKDEPYMQTSFGNDSKKRVAKIRPQRGPSYTSPKEQAAILRELYS